jgi:hypothetical protein
VVFPGFQIEMMATGLSLPVNLAFIPNSNNVPESPLLYVTELYGQIETITKLTNYLDKVVGVLSHVMIFGVSGGKYDFRRY